MAENGLSASLYASLNGLSSIRNRLSSRDLLADK